MKTKLFTYLVLAVAVAAPAQASITAWGVWSWDHTEPVHVMLTPGDGGDALANASYLGGAPADATIRVQLWASGGVSTDPPEATVIVNFPHEDIWLEAPGLASCIGGAVADANTDSEGWFTFSGSPKMGGSNDPNAALPGLTVVISGAPLDDLFVPIRPHILVNSPDLNADGQVNMPDIPPFADDYYGQYNFRSDFVYDGVINLSDVVRFVESLGESCP